jgi:YhcH/YjgK/YiaL family protein
MIYDRKQNLEQYKGISQNLDCAIDYLLRMDFTNMEAGKYSVKDDEVFALVQTPETRGREQALWESHRKYIDIQYLLCGKEKIGFQSIDTLTVSQPYDPQKDIAFYQDNNGGFLTELEPDTFVVCFPNDAHMPLVCSAQPQLIKKVVVKVKI